MLTVGLVVMVIFLFLRNLAATVIPSVAVPLSLVGTFGVMYLLGYSLNNLTLMALTISTGFVVDDAIVMIENISRYIEAGRQAARRGAQRIRADRLHHRVADRLADRGADSLALHGRYRRPALPRVRRHAERHDSGFGGRLADADAHDVRQAAEAQTGTAAEAALYRASERAFEKIIDFYGRTLQVRFALPERHSAGGRGYLGSDDLPLHRHSQGIFPDPGHRRDPGSLGGGRRRFPSRRCRTGSRRSRR